MKLSSGKIIRHVLLSVVCLCLLATMTFAAGAAKGPSSDGKKATVNGIIISRDGDLVKVADKEDGSTVAVRVTDTTKIERKKGLLDHTDMNVAALVPGLTIKAEGVRNAEGQLDAKKIKFNPDVFAVTVAQQQQIMDNKAAVGRAQTTADLGLDNAATAQSSANKAQSTADQGVATAQAAGTAAAANTVAVQAVNKRVSDLGDYVPVDQTGVYFADGSYRLTDAGRAALDRLISANSNINGYVIEIAGYTSSTGSARFNQRLSEERAAVVAQYLRENAAVPLWRIVVPAGYGETHPVADNSDAKGRALNRRVEVKVLVNKGVQEGALQAGSLPAGS
ncbi:MAG TPA: OmpA family protein [Terriglobales bacterium]|nr:OmpA family protein [Terriglobales bacterium]